MKKFLTSFAFAAIFSVAANAQETATTTDKSAENRAKWQSASSAEKQQILQDKENKLGERKEKLKEREANYNAASPEKKSRMDAMEKLSPEQRDAVRQEMDRHRAAMKNLGIELPTPPARPNNQ